MEPQQQPPTPQQQHAQQLVVTTATISAAPSTSFPHREPQQQQYQVSSAPYNNDEELKRFLDSTGGTSINKSSKMVTTIDDQDKIFQIFQDLWDRPEQPERPSAKRKADDMMSADSTDVDAEPTTSSSSVGGKRPATQNNKLLAELLSKRSSQHEPVVNTQQVSCNATGIPQQNLPTSKELASKLLEGSLSHVSTVGKLDAGRTSLENRRDGPRGLTINVTASRESINNPTVASSAPIVWGNNANNNNTLRNTISETLNAKELVTTSLASLPPRVTPQNVASLGRSSSVTIMGNTLSMDSNPSMMGVTSTGLNMLPQQQGIVVDNLVESSVPNDPMLSNILQQVLDFQVSYLTL